MKKVLIGILMLALTTGVFAQVTVSGDVQLDVGIGKTDSNGDFSYDAPLEGGVDWYWNLLDNGGTDIRATAKADKVSAWVQVRTDLVWTGNVTVDLDPLALSIGHNRLPVAFWSSYELYADNHYGIGPSATNRSTYIQAKIADFFIGIADSTNSAIGGNYLNGNPFTQAFSPVFYLGYNFTDDDVFTAGASFVGVYLSKDLVGNDGAFSWMGNLHGRLLSLDPIGLGLNVSMYGAPVYGPFTLTDAMHGGGKDGLVLEALLDFSVGIENLCALGFGAGLVVNLTDETKGGGGLGVKLGLSANFDLGNTGFSLVPGLAYTTFTKGGGDTIEAGISFFYSF